VILVIDVLSKRWARRVVSKRVVFVHRAGPRPSL